MVTAQFVALPLAMFIGTVLTHCSTETCDPATWGFPFDCCLPEQEVPLPDQKVPPSIPKQPAVQFDQPKSDVDLSQSDQSPNRLSPLSNHQKNFKLFARFPRRPIRCPPGKYACPPGCCSIRGRRQDQGTVSITCEPPQFPCGGSLPRCCDPESEDESDQRSANLLSNQKGEPDNNDPGDQPNPVPVEKPADNNDPGNQPNPVPVVKPADNNDPVGQPNPDGSDEQPADKEVPPGPIPEGPEEGPEPKNGQEEPEGSGNTGETETQQRTKVGQGERRTRTPYPMSLR